MRLQPVLLSFLLSASAAFSADSALLNLVMPEARMVAGIDIERARDSFFGRKVMEEMNDKNGDFGRIAALTGFDPRRDLKEVIFATTDVNSRVRQSPALIVVRGVFDTARIGSALKTNGIIPSETIGGIDFFTKTDGKDDSALAFLDGSIAVAGNRDAVRQALRRRISAGAPLTASTYDKVQLMSRENDIWMVTSVPVSELSNVIPGDRAPQAGMMGGEAFKGIEQMAMGVRFGAETMDLTAETVSRSQKDASGIADIVRFLSTMVQMNRDKPDVKALATALDAMSLTTSDRTTRLTISLPVAEMQKMIDTRKQGAPKRI